VQAVAELHEIALSWGKTPAGAPGRDWSDQLVPFQTSAISTLAPPLRTAPPIAVQAVGEVHDTPSSPLAVAPVGFGVDWTDQLVPSQRSAKVRWLPKSMPAMEPTAVQAEADVHDTPRRMPYPSGGGRVVVDWIDQLVPSHASTKGKNWPALSTEFPTAMQVVAEGHDTPLRTP
jgi:hypothetical protein